MVLVDAFDRRCMTFPQTPAPRVGIDTRSSPPVRRSPTGVSNDLSKRGQFLPLGACTGGVGPKMIDGKLGAGPILEEGSYKNADTISAVLDVRFVCAIPESSSNVLVWTKCDCPRLGASLNIHVVSRGWR